MTDLDLLANTAHKAGAIASRFFNAAPQIWDKPDGQGPVTEADLAVDKLLRETLCAARPDYGWLSEETEDTPARSARSCVFVVDPIDGTRAFIEGNKDWAISVAVVQNGAPTAAVVYLPERNQMFTAALGRGAWLNNAPINVSAAPTGQPSVLTARPTLDGSHWKNGTPPDLDRQFRSSLAFRLCLVAQGRYDAMMTLRPSWEWDIAAGSLILQEAGGTVTDKTGAPLVFNNPHPQVNGVVGGTPSTHALIAAALA